MSRSGLGTATATVEAHGVQARNTRPSRGTFRLEDKLSKIRETLSPFNACREDETKLL